MEKREMSFRVDTMRLLNEIADCAMPRTQGVLKIPLNIFRMYLCQVAERAIEINDPRLNIIMLSMGLYNTPPDEIVEAISQQLKLIEKDDSN